MKLRLSRLWMVLAVVLTLSAALLLLWPRPAAGMPWRTDYSRALQESRETERVLVAYLYTDWCTYCSQMEKESFRNAEVIRQIEDRYVWLKLNAETDPEGTRLAQEFGISGYPTFILLNAEGEEMERMQGYFAPDRFAAALEETLHKPDSLASLREASRRQPDSPEAHFELAASLLQRRNLAQAKQSFARAIELDPTGQSNLTDAGHFYIAYILTIEGEHEEALSRLDQLEGSFPQTRFLQNAQLLRGEIYYRTGEDDKARQILTDYLAQHPSSLYEPEVRKLLGELKPNPTKDLFLAPSH